MLIERTIKRGEEIPLAAFSGNARDCGREYVSCSLKNYPGYTVYLKQAVDEWSDLDKKVEALFEKRAPYVLGIYRGMLEELRKNSFAETVNKNEQIAKEECTSFAVAPEHCTDNSPISGQNKDTGIDSMKYYTVLRMRLSDGPTILVVAYPGELLGYGMWSNGNTLFRNDLKSSAGSTNGLSMVQFGLLAFASSNVAEMVELAKQYGIKGAGNLLLADRTGDSVSVEFNAGGVSFIYPEKGILTHANHPVGNATKKFERYPDRIEEENSHYRHDKLQSLIYSNSGVFDKNMAFECLADHSRYPRGICRHIIGEREDKCTTTAIVAEPEKGYLSVTKGPPCLNNPVTYSI
jgi:isopenicillin-N N-acyltransferase like protein